MARSKTSARPKRAAIALAVLALLCGGSVAVAAATSIYVEVGGVKTSFSASIVPKALPRAKRVPIAVGLSAKVEGRGGEHIPAMTRATIGIDRSLAIDARGVPVCTPGQLENQTTDAAVASCAAAQVGSGSAVAEIAFDGGAPIEASTRLVAFNGGTVGRTTTVLVHAYLTTPSIQALVVPVTLTRRSEGGFGLGAQVTIPRIASGAGSLSRFDLTFRKRVTTAAGAAHGYLLSRCSDGNLVFEPEVEFAEGNRARGPARDQLLLAQVAESG